MQYNSFVYLTAFLGGVFLFYSVVPKRFKWLVLLLSSYGFYLINSRKLVIFLMITTCTVYFAGIFLNKIADGAALARKGVPPENKKEYKAMIKWQKRAVVGITVLLNVGLLVFLKYYNFLGGAANSVLAVAHIPQVFPKLNLVLPLGISFYTLQAVSYLVDVYRGKYRADCNFGKVALFLSFFPQIVEGPIGRFDLLANQLYEGHSFDYNRIPYGGTRILWGLIKKMVIADRANAFVNSIFDHSETYSGPIIIIATLIYTLQIYTDFSGSIDIASGSAELFGISLSKNFDRPFFSHTVNEFWRRWHITLGSWLRDYIFYPVSLSKAFSSLSKWTQKHLNAFFSTLIPASFALFMVWMTNGFWHGASWKYVAYGLYYFMITLLGMLFEPLFVRFFEKTQINRKGRGFRFFQLVRTFVLVNVGMMLFRAPSLRTFFSIFASTFQNFSFHMIQDGSFFKLGADRHDMLVLVLGAILLLVVGLLQEKGHCLRKELSQKNIVLRWSVYFAMIFIVIIFGAYGIGYQAVDPIYGGF